MHVLPADGAFLLAWTVKLPSATYRSRCNNHDALSEVAALAFAGQALEVEHPVRFSLSTLFSVVAIAEC